MNIGTSSGLMCLIGDPIDSHLGKVRGRVARIKKLVANGRSTPAAPQPNDAEVDIWKLDTVPAVDLAALDDY